MPSITIELYKHDDGYITKPVLILKVLDPSNPISELGKTLTALIDTGADISFLIRSTHNLQEGEFQRKSSRKVIHYAIDGFVAQQKIELDERDFLIHNQNDRIPQVLLGRDFLSHFKMTYYGRENKVVLER